jgi:DNA repair exonuclease SbcCD ATPase subunit
VKKEDHLRWVEQLRESQRLTTHEEERKEEVLEVFRVLAETSTQLDSEGLRRRGRQQRSPTSTRPGSRHSAGAQGKPRAEPNKPSDAAVGAIDAAIEGLEAQRAAAEAEAARITKELEELSEQRAVLALAVFSGEKWAAKELEEAEERAADLSRMKEEAEDAAREYARMIEEAEAQQRQEERYDALAVERHRLDSRAQEALEQLVEILRQLDDIEREQDSTAAGPSSEEHAITLERWLKHNLRPWLGVCQDDIVVETLPEADRRARKREPDGES